MPLRKFENKIVQTLDKREEGIQAYLTSKNSEYATARMQVHFDQTPCCMPPVLHPPRHIVSRRRRTSWVSWRNPVADIAPAGQGWAQHQGPGSRATVFPHSFPPCHYLFILIVLHVLKITTRIKYLSKVNLSSI